MWFVWTMNNTIGCYNTLKDALSLNNLQRANKINKQGIREYVRIDFDYINKEKIEYTIFIANEKLLEEIEPLLLRDLKKELKEKENK